MVIGISPIRTFAATGPKRRIVASPKSCQPVSFYFPTVPPKHSRIQIVYSDIDLLCHWLSPFTPSRVSSFGSLRHFRKASKPPAAGSATRCFDCSYESECPYSARRGISTLSAYPSLLSLHICAVYLDPVSQGHTSWPVSILVDGVPDIENVTHALRNGPYGQCVYESDNDVCDNQVCLGILPTILFY